MKGKREGEREGEGRAKGGGKGRAWLPWPAAALLLVDLYLTLRVAPTAANFRAPLTQRIFYYHVPAAWVAYLAFFVTAALGALALWRDQPMRWDAWAAASAEVGTVFSLIALATGLVWAKQEFLNYSPFEDAKVISLVVLILAYFAYFALRAGVAERERRARLAAVYGILAFLGVPLSYFASRASVHPDLARSDESLDPRLAVFLIYSLVAFTALYAALVQARHRISVAQEEAERDG
jgi:heme exporter protein C